MGDRHPDHIPTYIIKPATGLQGAGIKITQSAAALQKVIVTAE
jgi:hypothetical protein